MAQRTVPLSELADIIRSKNAGPFRITFDILFSDPARYRLVRDSHALTASRGQSLRDRPSEITSFYEVDMASAIKVTLRRPRTRAASAKAICTAASSMCRCSALPFRWPDDADLAGMGVCAAGASHRIRARILRVPFGVVLVDSFRTKAGMWTLEHYAKVMGELYYWEVLLLTFKLSLNVTLATFLVGDPLAYYIVRHVKSRLIRSLLYIVVVTPLFTSNIVRAFGWMVLLGRRGLVNDVLIATGAIESALPLLYGQFSIVIGLVYIMAPFMVLTVASVLQNIDRSLEDAARDLGASAWTTFWRVTFPLSLPGVIAGSLIVFTLSVSAYVTPSILSGGRQM